jgi:hypothetical protein
MATGTTEQERVWFAREVFSLFVKCFTNLKLYPHHHVNVRETMDAFISRLRSYVALHGTLRVGVTQANLTVEDQPVYAEENRSENLAFRLYVDGLREISIQNGVTAEEAKKLAHIFYQVIVDPRVDTTLLLWEAEFTNIEYAAVNSLSEAWDQPDYLKADSLKLLNDMNRHVDDVVAQITAGAHARSTYNFELTDGAAEMDEMRRLADQAGEGKDGEREDIFAVSEDALEAFRKECGAWGPDRLLKVLVEASLDGLMLEPDLVGRDNVAWLLREAVEMALRTNDMELLSALLTRYEGELALTEDEDNEAAFKDVFAWLGQEENLDRLIAQAKGQGLGGPKAFTRILGLLGPNGMRAAVKAYLDAGSSKDLREALTAFLSENFALDPKAILPLLAPERDAETVRAALFVVSKQRSLEMKLLEEMLNTARRHADAKIQEYATHLWRTTTTEGMVTTFMDALTNSESKKDRMRAMEKLVEANHRPALDRLKKAVEAKTFLDREPDEKLLTLDSIRRLGGQTAIAFLQSQVQRAGTLFNRKAVNEVREAATQVLERLKKGGK